MIAHMLHGEVKDYHVQLSRALASAYRLRPVTANIDPHLTLKAPFDALSSDILDVEHIIDRFVRTRSVSTYSMKGFGNFGERVVYMDVQPSSDMQEFFKDCKDALREIPWLEFKPHEQDTKFHATLCYPKDATQSDEIVARLNERGGKEFLCTLDTIALLKKGEHRWEVLKEYRFSDGGDAIDAVVI